MRLGELQVGSYGLEQDTANFFCKGPDNTFFHLVIFFFIYIVLPGQIIFHILRAIWSLFATDQFCQYCRMLIY